MVFFHYAVENPIRFWGSQVHWEKPGILELQLRLSRIKLEQQTPCPTSNTQTSLARKPTFPIKKCEYGSQRQDSLTKFSINLPFCFLILWPTSLYHQPISFSRGTRMRFRSPVSWTHILEINGNERPLGNFCTLNNPDIGGAIRVARDGVFSYNMRSVLECFRTPESSKSEGSRCWLKRAAGKDELDWG